MTLAVIITCLVFAMILGPIFLIQPSKRDKHAAELRTVAMNNGIQVSMMAFKGESVAVYQCPWAVRSRTRASWSLSRAAYQHEIHFAGSWQWQDDSRPEPVLLNWLAGNLIELPADVLEVHASVLGLACMWTERGGVETLERLIVWLRRGAETHSGKS